jgi:hypothetical protein
MSPLIGRSTEPNNGVSVRGLRVLRSHEYRRISRWRLVVSSWMFLGGVHDPTQNWHVMTVTGSDGAVLARRRFAKRAEAERGRTAFVERVATLTDEEIEVADLQGLLDTA